MAKRVKNVSCNQEMLRMIDILNKLQDKLVSLGVNNLHKELPQIAVVGSQSAGKSSVLESFVGRDFLPRGKDVVTRRPLILQLNRNKDDDRTYGKFSHSPKIFTDFDEIKLEIETETDRLVPDSSISSEPINLNITSPDVLDLNLVDLPGMTKNPVGNQPEDIETIVKSLIMEYISKDNCLILAVTEANQDLSTSDAIKLSREVDPNGKRTIGVLTKLDLMDRGTDALNILLNKHKINLRRGFIGVKCRSQNDINNKKSLSEAIEDEKEFFAKNITYSEVRNRLGIENLQKFLQNQLAEHLFIELPALRDKFEDNLDELEGQIEKIGVQINQMNAKDLISYTLEALKQNFRNEVGTGDAVPLNRTNGGAKINSIMNSDYPKAIESVVRDEKRIKQEIQNGIMNIFGTRLELFMPNKVLTTVVRQQIELMREPSVKYVDNVFIELESIVRNSAKGIGRFPKLTDIYTQLTLHYLRECKKSLKEKVEDRVNTEKAYFNTKNEEFGRLLEFDKKSKELPLTKMLIDKRKNSPIKSGWIKYVKYMTKYFFKIEDHMLYWFADSISGAKVGQFNLKLVEPHISGKKSLVLKKTSYDYNEETMTLEFESGLDLLEWLNVIMDQINDKPIETRPVLQTIVEVAGSPSLSEPKRRKIEPDQNGNDSDSEDMKYPIHMKGQVDEVLKVVVAYIKSTEIILKDALPKLCQKELIDATEDFITLKLRGRVEEKDLKLEDLVDVDPMEEERKVKMALKRQYEEALKTMNDVLKPTIDY